MLEPALAVAVLVMAAAVLVLALTRRQASQIDTSNLDKRLDSLNQQLGQVTSQASAYQETVNRVHESLGGLTQASQRILEVGQDMRQLQDLLAVPKLRGGLGELLLEDLLRQVLPQDRYQTQFTFREGQRVDAVIRLTNGIVPVDAKFPLESFQRLNGSTNNAEERRVYQRQFQNDVKHHIDAIAQRYIVPGETLDFALMYVPSENVYYEVMLNSEGKESILDYAWRKRVIPTSPNSFYAYLQVIALGLRGLQIEQHARTMVDSLSRLRNDFEKFADDYRLVGRHLNNAQAKYSEALPKLDSLQRALPGHNFDTSAVEGAGEPQSLEDSDSEARGEAPWEYDPPQRRRGPNKQRE